MTRDALSMAWIRPLAQPYLRGYRAMPERRDTLRGYWFRCPGTSSLTKQRAGAVAARGSAAALGFFVGYLLHSEDYAFLRPEPPECLVFAFVHPVGGILHRRLVRRRESLLRKTFEYIRWLTHRPPRFLFYEDQLPAMVRHLSMRGWPRAKYAHYSRNFFIETLAWLVRSGLVRKFLAEPVSPAEVLQTIASDASGMAQRKVSQ